LAGIGAVSIRAGGLGAPPRAEKSTLKRGAR
jgi:hypothetical protein